MKRAINVYFKVCREPLVFTLKYAERPIDNQKAIICTALVQEASLYLTPSRSTVQIRNDTPSKTFMNI